MTATTSRPALPATAAESPQLPILGQAVTAYHDERCPTCGRFVPIDAAGYYDFPPGGDQESGVVVYCDERCAKRKSPPAHYWEAA